MRNPLKSQEAFAGHPSFTTNRSRHSLRWSTVKMSTSTIALSLFFALISGLWIWLSQFSTIGLGFASSAHKAEQYQLAAAVAPAVETAPVPHSKDAADDPVIWIHPSDPAKSAVMGNDKLGAYEVYNITTGAKLQSLALDVANTDIRYNFPLGGERIALIAGYSATKNGLIAFKVAVDPATGDPHLVDVTRRPAPT
ncbi:MAG: hypothetical protein KatS3mg057_0839 [Herpetosiphonaceae bacterium]|nr:MAG: hypothetical protein KatS3mg057_0839 [Herpetosiphonaceae bacterium]